jgi:hypothetical protein
MTPTPDAVSLIALTMGVAWASGIRLYAAVFMLGFLANTGHLSLPPDLQILQDPLVMIAAGFMYFVEFFADKTPGVDSGWDTLHTFIRIPAGAILAAQLVGDVSPAAQMTAFLVGGGLAAGAHVTKAGTRVLINTSPEPFSNIGMSLAEDAAVLGAFWAALHYPWLLIGAVVGFMLLAIWLLPKLWRAIVFVARKIASWFGGGKPEPLARAAIPGTAGTAPPAV